GPDVLSGNGGIDMLLGGAGNDHLTGGAGADVLDGGADSDTASYSTATVGMTIDLRFNQFTGDGVGDTLISIERFEGTNFNDTINGDDNSNPLLSGIDGDDILRGFAGNDLLDGGAGADTLEGGDDADFLGGGPGADVIDGGAGIDSVAYTSSKTPVTVSLRTGLGTGGDAQGDVLISVEILYGSPLPFGDLSIRYLGEPNSVGTGDTLEGSDGADNISGFGGADFIDGGMGDDVLYGDAAGTSGNPPSAPGLDDDILRGGPGNDMLFGQQDDDDLDGGPGQDTLEGGDGNDHLRTLDTASIDFLDGGAGINRLSADYSDKPVAITWIAGQLNDYTFADGDMERNFQLIGELDTGELDDVIRLDFVQNDDYANVLRTNGGDDLIYSADGPDLVEAGSGQDVIFAGNGSDMVDAGDGDDFVNGGGNNAMLTWGGFLNATVTGFTGPEEVLIGGAGTDTISFVDVAKATPGGLSIGVHVDLGGDFTDFGGRGVAISGFENVIGTEYGDDLKGTDGPNIINPLHGGGYTQGLGSGPDRVDGRGGLDTLVIDFSREDLSGSTGVTSSAGTGAAGNPAFFSRQTVTSMFWFSDSVLVTGVEQYQITGASKDDQITGGNFNYDDILIGLGGNDTLSGQGGGDTLLGGEGDDFLTGQGIGTQAYNGTAGGFDLLDGGNGDDVVEDIAFDGSNAPSALAASTRFQLDGGAGFDIFSANFSDHPEAIVWTSAAPANIEFPDGAYARNFEQLRHLASGGGADVITQLGRVANIIYTNGGDDVVAPGLGNDVVNGGAGSNDLLVLDYSLLDLPTYTGVTGGGGNGGIFRRDIPGGGPALDYVAYTAFERVNLTGTPRADTLNDLSGDDIIFTGAGNDTVTSVGGNNYFDGGDGDDVLTGYANSATNVNDTFIGGEGNDTLNGQSGSDTLMGGPGNDTLIGAGAFGFAPGGLDLIDGGDGDDFVDESYGVAEAFQYMPVGTVLKLDGGTGFDILSADFGRETQDIVWIAGQVNVNEFANGGYIRNFEQIIEFTTGTGNDLLIQPGRINNEFSTRGGNDIVNPGLGIDIVFAGSGGDDLLILDYSLGDDANLGGLIFTGASGTRRNTSTNAIVDSINNGNGNGFDRLQITGGSKADNITGGEGADILVGNAGDDALNGGNGDDFLDGGPGADSMTGGAGNDRFIVDAIADIVSENSGGGIDTVDAHIDYTLPANIENIVLVGRALTGTGNALANIITGNARSNVLSGGDGADILTGGFAVGLAGSQEIDRLNGGAGADTFVLGDVNQRFYDDRSSLTPGTGAYAQVEDFTPSAGDRLRLKGGAAEYFLGASGVAGVSGTGLFHDTDADGAFDPGYDELLAILDSPDALTPANTINAAMFV
ncbi:MAG: calcium-binding protein, partial [Chthoniobacteraceae bacterium]